MLLPRVIPVLLLKGHGLVKTVQFNNPSYVGDVINAVHIFNDKQVDELVLLSINGEPPDMERIMGISDECFVPFAYGGGITTLEQITQLVRNGCEKVVLNSALITHPTLLPAAAEKVGSQAVAACIDYRQNQVYINNGRIPTGVDPISHALRCIAQGCGEILLQSIDRDGTYRGYDLDMIRQMSGLCSVPLTVCGGASSLKDMRDALDCGASAVAAGSFFVYHGKKKAVLISYPTREEKKVLYEQHCMAS